MSIDFFSAQILVIPQVSIQTKKKLNSLTIQSFMLLLLIFLQIVQD